MHCMVGAVVSMFRVPISLLSIRLTSSSKIYKCLMLYVTLHFLLLNTEHRKVAQLRELQWKLAKPLCQGPQHHSYVHMVLSIQQKCLSFSVLLLFVVGFLVCFVFAITTYLCINIFDNWKNSRKGNPLSLTDKKNPPPNPLFWFTGQYVVICRWAIPALHRAPEDQLWAGKILS